MFTTVKAMKYLFTLAFSFTNALLASFAFATDNAENCSSAIGKPLMAEYSITTKTDHGTAVKHLQLWRQGDQVAIHYPKNNVTELWGITSTGKLHLVKMFEQHKRGIEYQPNEIKGAQDWSAKQQLISNRAIASMELQKTTGAGCELTQHYSKTTPSGNYHLQWLANRTLIQSYKRVREHSSVHWKLLHKHSNKELIAAKFARLQNFNTTDYADIGDNESDPFLRNMIHLGFVEHGANGFYDSEGNSLHTH